MWDLSEEQERIAKARAAPRGAGGGAAGEDGGGGAGETPVVRYRCSGGPATLAGLLLACTAPGAPRVQAPNGSAHARPRHATRRARLLSAVEASHSAAVADIQWLPGIEVARGGRVLPTRAGSAGAPPGGGGLARSSTLGAALQGGAQVPW